MARQYPRSRDPRDSMDDWSGLGDGGNDTRFNPLVIDGRKPIEAAWKIGGWFTVGIPFLVAVIWGAYDSTNLMGVLGISTRRAGGAAITESRPIGESLLNGSSGKGFRPTTTGRRSGEGGSDDEETARGESLLPSNGANNRGR